MQCIPAPSLASWAVGWPSPCTGTCSGPRGCLPPGKLSGGAGGLRVCDLKSKGGSVSRALCTEMWLCPAEGSVWMLGACQRALGPASWAGT